MILHHCVISAAALCEEAGSGFISVNMDIGADGDPVGSH